MSPRKAWWYSIEGYHDDDERIGVHSFMSSPRDVARDAAELDHQNGGWEASWPRVFVIYDSEDGPAIGRFEINRETVPEFDVSEELELPQPPDRLLVEIRATTQEHEEDQASRVEQTAIAPTERLTAERPPAAVIDDTRTE